EFPVALYDHEGLHRSGHPDGRKQEEFRVEAGTDPAADTYDALTSDRPYRKACTEAEARRVLIEEAKTRLDPSAVAALLGALDQNVTAFEAAPRRALAF